MQQQSQNQQSMNQSSSNHQYMNQQSQNLPSMNQQSQNHQSMHQKSQNHQSIAGNQSLLLGDNNQSMENHNLHHTQVQKQVQSQLQQSQMQQSLPSERGASNIQNTVPFIQKLETILSDTNQDSLQWSASGDTILITDQQIFSKIVLPLHFRHNQLSSFIRQLNKHGFRRIKNSSLLGNSIDNQPILEYSNPFFTKHTKSHWHLIRWNTHQNSSASSATSPEIGSPANSIRIDALFEQNDYVHKQVENAEIRLKNMESTLSNFNQRIAKQALLIDKLTQMLNSNHNLNENLNTYQNQTNADHLSFTNNSQEQVSSHFMLQEIPSHLHQSHKRSYEDTEKESSMRNYQQEFDSFQPDTTFITISANNTLPEYPTGNSMPSLIQGSMSPNRYRNMSEEESKEQERFERSSTDSSNLTQTIQNILLLSSAGFNYHLITEKLKLLNIGYTEISTVKSLLETLAQSDISTYDAIFFDGSLMNADSLAPLIRTINSSIRLLCLSDCNGGPATPSDYQYGKTTVEIVSNPPSIASLATAFKRSITGQR